MAAIPTQAELAATLGSIFTFAGYDGVAVPARLIAAPEGVPMDRNYVCYSALFELPAGTQLGQDTYRVTSPAGVEWDLLVTPHRPTPEGVPMMGAVFHCRRPSDENVAA